MKKGAFLSCLLALIALLSLTIFSSCGKDAEDKGEETNKVEQGCQHEWKSVSSLLPGCYSFGYNNLTCKSCGETKTVQLEPKGHSYTPVWEWASDYSYASVRLICQENASHNEHVSAIIKEETVQPTCKQAGTRKLVATVVAADGTEYTDTKEIDLGLGKCVYEYKFTLAGKSCLDGFDVEAKCKVCEGKMYFSGSSHITYEMASFDTCGGKITANICPCGKQTMYIHPNMCDGEIQQTWQETDENGVTHSFDQRYCFRCGMLIIYDYYNDYNGCYTYVNRNVKIMKGDKELYSFLHKNYETLATHELVYSYDGGKIESCENGYTYYVECKKCSYDEYISTTSHSLTFQTAKYDLSELGVCGGYIQEKECPCGLNKAIFYSLFCDYTYLDYIEDGADGSEHFVRKYSCDECKMELICDQYIKEEKVYESYILKINDEIKYELEYSYKAD